MSRLADHLAFKECQIFKSEIPSGGTSAVSLWSQSLSEPTFLSSGDAVAWLLMEWGGGSAALALELPQRQLGPSSHWCPPSLCKPPVVSDLQQVLGRDNDIEAGLFRLGS